MVYQISGTNYLWQMVGHLELDRGEIFQGISLPEIAWVPEIRSGNKKGTDRRCARRTDIRGDTNTPRPNIVRRGINRLAQCWNFFELS